MRRTLLAVLLLGLAAAAAARPRPGRTPVETAPAWIRQHAIPLASIEPDGSDTDLAALLPLVAKARVIALGDATHGTHELFALKQRLVPWLVVNANVRTIALEAPYGNLEAIRDYVMTGDGDPAALLQSSDYYFWDSEEVLAIVRWVRAWNAAGNPAVEIVGIDPFHPETSAARVVSFLRDVDQGAARNAKRNYGCVAGYGADPYAYAMTTAAYRSACHVAVAAVREAMIASRSTYPATGSAADLDRAIHAARNVELGEEMLASGITDRDRGMAENVQWLAERPGAGAVLVWGHNEHFGKEPYTFYSAEPVKSAGTMLHERYGDGYVAIGSLLLSGTFNAVQFEGDRGYVRQLTIDPAGADDWAALFASALSIPAIVPLRGAMPMALMQPHTIRVAGSAVISLPPMKPLIENLASRFDAIVYLPASTPTHLRHTPVLGGE